MLVDALQPDPVLADRVQRVIAVVLLARARVHPRRVDEPGLRPHAEASKRRAVVLTQADVEACHIHALRARSHPHVEPEVRLVYDGMKGPGDQLDALPFAQRAGIIDAVDAQDEPPVGGDSVVPNDRAQQLAGADRMHYGEGVAVDDLRAEDQSPVERLQGVARERRIGR